MPEETSEAKLICEARHLRDHLLRSGGAKVDQLVSALRPFDRADGGSAGEADITKLYTAFQATHMAARAEIDEHTLDEVLKGRSPHVHSSAIGGAILSFLGVLLVLLALHYSHWSNKTQFLLTEAENFDSFKHFEQVSRVVELARLSDAAGVAGAAGPASNVEPIWMYLEGLKALEAHYADEDRLRREMNGLEFSVSPLRPTRDRVIRRVCRTDHSQRVQGVPLLVRLVCPQAASPEPPANTNRFIRQACRAYDLRTQQEVPLLVRMLCPEAPSIAQPNGMIQSASGEPVEEEKAKIVAGGDDPSASWSIDNQFSEYTASMGATMIRANRGSLVTYNDTTQQPLVNYLYSRQAIEASERTLGDRLTIVQRWALPIIYGALGSVIYCMWRIISPNLAALGFWRTVLRTSFAGLAALTLSMLLIPSNAFALGDQASRPVIYLISFAFGYSIEAFVSTLNLLNSYVTQNMAVRRGNRKSEPA